MIQARFTGFETGVPVGVSITQGTSNASGSVPAWGVFSTPITASLAARRFQGTAPFGFQMEIEADSPTARNDLPYFDLEYVTSTGDSGTYRYLDNAPIWGTSKTTAFGPVVSHVYETPGTYNGTVTVHDGENTPLVVPFTVTVDDPDTTFAGAATAVVSSAGNFAGAPAGAAEFTSISEALSHLRGRQNQRLLLRYGETYTETVTFVETNGANRRMCAAAFGTPSDGNPKIDKTANGGSAVIFDVDNGVSIEQIVHNIDYEGDGDPTSTSPGTTRNGDGIDFISAAGQTNTAYKTVCGCHIKNAPNFSINVSAPVTSGRILENIFIGDCWLDGWMDFGFIAGVSGWGGVSGTRIQQAVGTQNGTGKGTSPQDWPDHGPVRLSTVIGPWSFHNNDFRSLNSWSSPNSNSYQIQPCIRWNSGKNGASDYDQKLNVDRMRAEGQAATPINEASNHTRKNVYALIDRMYAVLSSHQEMTVAHGGTTVRNAVLVRPNTPTGISTSIQNPASLIKEDDAADYDSGLNPGNLRRMEIYSCTFADLVTDANSTSRTGNSPRNSVLPTLEPSAAYVGANILYTPNRSSSGENPGPFDTANGWTPGYEGERWQGSALDASRGYDAATTASYDLLTGNPDIGGAGSAKVSLIDFYGNVRANVLAGLTRNTPSLGHMEPPVES